MAIACLLVNNQLVNVQSVDPAMRIYGCMEVGWTSFYAYICSKWLADMVQTNFDIIQKYNSLVTWTKIRILQNGHNFNYCEL